MPLLQPIPFVKLKFVTDRREMLKKCIATASDARFAAFGKGRPWASKSEFY